MAIGHRADSSGDVHAPAGTQAITLPTGAVSTDIVIAAFGSGRSGGTCGNWTAPAGWTLVGQITDQINTLSHVSLDVYWALGNVANLTFTKSGTVSDMGWVALAFTGCDTTTPIDATGTPNSTTTAVASITVNAVTVVTDQAWELIGLADWRNGTFSATGFTNAENAAASESAACMYNTTPKSTGSTGTVSVTSSGSTASQVIDAVPFALRPAASSTSGASMLPIIVPNNRVGPQVLRQNWRAPYPLNASPSGNRRRRIIVSGA